MEVGEYGGYQKSEWLKLAEQIFECKERKKELELQLSSEQFHYRYIPKRLELIRGEVLFRLLFIIPLTLIWLAVVVWAVFVIGSEEMRYSAVGGLGLLVASLVLVFGGYAAVRLWIREGKMLFLLFFSSQNDAIVKFAENHNIDTIQKDEYDSKEKIEMLKEQISALDTQIVTLMEKRQKALEEKKEREDLLRRKQVLFDEHPDRKKPEGRFTLREDPMGEEDASQIYEYYVKEEQYIQQELLRLDGRLNRLDKEIVEIDENFERTKKSLLISFIAFVVVVLIQGAFTGVLGGITSILCFIDGLVYVFYLESKCKKPILLYLVEHDSNLTREYAFCNNIFPVKQKRKELLEEIENEKKELEDIKGKRSALTF